MNKSSLLTLCGLLFLCLLCGCPRSNATGNGNAGDTPKEGEAMERPADTPAENPCSGTAENPCGAAENPCGTAENPCGAAANPCNPCAAANPCNPCGAAENPCADPNDTVTTVVLETTDGDIVLEVHSAWSPLGAAHFLELVKAGFYDGAPWFRVINGFVAQAGISPDPAMNSKWENSTIQDEPVKVGNKRGFVAFGKTQMPNSRSTHIFINYSDNSSSLNGQGFACFAQVVSGMEIADGLFKAEFNNQGQLAAEGGMDAFKAMFPDADYIKKAYIKE